MGDHEHGQPERLLQRLDQRVEIARRDRIETRGRLVEKHDRRIERERARQRHALGHAAGQFGRKLVAVLRPEPDHFELGGGDLVHQRIRQHEIFAHRKLDVLPHGQRGKQRALLEQDAPSPGRALRGRGHGCRRSATPMTSISPPWRGMRPMMVRISTDLPPPDAPTRPRISPRRTSSDKMIEHDLPAEADHEVAHADRKLSGRFLHRYIPIEAKKTANSPSSTITRKIDFTTEVVVCLPSDSALPFTRKPSLQATMPITSAMNGALMMPTSKWVTEMASCSRAMKIAGPMPP